MSSGVPVNDLAGNERHIHLGGNPTIGAMRNFGCGHAKGEIVVFHDDDDYSAPGRVEDQIQRLQQSGKAVTGYRSMRFTDGRDWWLYSGTPDYALGTSLCFRRDWWQRHRFPNLQVGEDTEFVQMARRESQIVSVDAGNLMWATIHPQNTSPRTLRGKQWSKLCTPSCA